MYLFPLFPSCPFRGRHSKSFSPTSSSVTPTPWLSFTRSKNILCGLTLSLLPGTSIINTLWPAYLSKQSQPCLSSSTSPVLLYRLCMWESCIWSKAISPSVIKCTNNAIFPQKSSLNSILLRLNSLFKRPEKKHSHKQQTGLWTLYLFWKCQSQYFVSSGTQLYRRTLEHG